MLDARRELREQDAAEERERIAKQEARAKRRALSRLANTLRIGEFVALTVPKRLKPKYGRLVEVEDTNALYITLKKLNGRVIVVKDPLTVRPMSLLEVLAYEATQGPRKAS